MSVSKSCIVRSYSEKSYCSTCAMTRTLLNSPDVQVEGAWKHAAAAEAAFTRWWNRLLAEFFASWIAAVQARLC